MFVSVRANKFVALVEEKRQRESGAEGTLATRKSRENCWLGNC